MTRFAIVVLAGLAMLAASPQVDRVAIRVDTSVVRGPMTPIWAWFGNDEPNYAYMPDGKQLLSELAATSPVPKQVV